MGMGEKVMKVLLLFAASIVLASAKLTIYHGRVFLGGSNPGVPVQQVQGVATLALGGNPVSQFFDCNSTTGSNVIANLVWEKEGGNIRFAVTTRSNTKRLDLAQPNGGPVLDYQDEGIYTCRDMATGESVSLNVTGGTLAVCPAEPTYEAILGTNVSLTVYVSGYPAVRGEEIEWRDPSNLRLSLHPMRQMLVDSNKTLLIQNVRISDGGIYRIDLRRRIIGNSFLNVTSTIELNVLIIPTVISDPSSMMILEHDDVTFSCTFSGNPAPIIIWEREGGAMLPVVTRTMMTSVQSTTNSAFKIVTVHSEYTIRGVFLEDVGDYRCSAGNSASQTSVKTTLATLSVTPRLQLRAEVGRQIVAIPDSRLLKIANTPTDVKIECLGSGTLTWRASTGTTIPWITSASNPANNIYQRSDSTSNKQTLIIQTFVPSDRAVYTCSTNLGSMEISEAILITSSATDIYITEAVIYATPGNSISIYAVYTSPSTPIITWSFNGSVLDTASHPRYTASLDGNMMAVLSITSVARDVLGYYMVMIEEEGVIQNDNVRLLYPAPPTSSIIPTSLSVDEGDRVRFQCQVGGTDSTAYWTLEGDQPLPSSVTPNGNEIVIQSASRADAGRYVCTVVNRLGVSNSTAELIVFYPPIVTVTYERGSQISINQLLEVTAEEGDFSPTFSCSSDGYPTPALSWVGPVSGGKFPNGVAQNRQGTDQMLVWNRNLVYMDSGFYNCMAQNSRGSSTGTLNLLVKRSPTITSIYFTSPISSSSTSSFLVPLNHTGNILTCSGYGWPTPSIEWVREGQSLTGRISTTGKNQAFVSARLTLEEGERFGQSHVGDYSCIMWPGDGSNRTYTKVVTLTSSKSSVTPTLLPTCTSESSQENFQIRILDTECENWEESLKERIARDFQNEMINIISTECQNCAAPGASVTILDSPTCSSELQGAAVFRGSITTGGADTTEDIFCTLDAWYRAGPLLRVNNKLHLVDQKCSLMLDLSTNAECTIPPSTTTDMPIHIIIPLAVGGGVILVVGVAIACICFCYSLRKQGTVNMGKVRVNSTYEKTIHDQPRYTAQVTPKDPSSSLVDSPDPLYSTLDQSKIMDPFQPPMSRTNSDRTSPEFDAVLSRNNSAARLLNTNSSKGGRMFQIASDGGRLDENVTSTGDNLDGDYPAHVTMNRNALGNLSSQHSSFIDHASMVMAERRAVLGTSAVAKGNTSSQTADYEVVDPKYRPRQNTHNSNSSSKLSMKSSHHSAGNIQGQPPAQVKRHRSLMEGEVWTRHGDEDYAQLDRSIPDSARTQIGAGGYGKIGNSKCGRGGRGHSASSLQMSSINSSASDGAPANEGGSREARRQMSLPGRTENPIPEKGSSSRHSDDPRTRVSIEVKTPLSPAHEVSPPPPSYREVIFSDSSMMENNAYESSNLTRQVTMERPHVKLSNSLSNVASLEDGEVQQFWYNKNPSYSSLNNSAGPNSEVVQQRERRASSESFIKPTPYNQPITSVNTQRPEAKQQRERRASSQSFIKPDLTMMGSNQFSNMVLV